MRRIADLLALALVPGLDVSGQVRPDPGTVINGQVAVRVYVTLSDEETPHAPISGLRCDSFAQRRTVLLPEPRTRAR